MKIELLRDLKLKATDGQVFTHKTGDCLSLPRKVALKIISRGQARQVFSPPVRYKSDLLEETIWLVNDISQFEEAEKQDPGTVTYTTLEYYRLLQMKKKEAQMVHEVKKVFPSSIILSSGTAWVFDLNDGEMGGGENMRKLEAFPSKYLTKEDLDQPKVWTIRAVKIEDLENEGEKDSKPILYFREQISKPVVLNVTNWGLIEELYGDESDLWIDHKIELYRNNDIMFGKKKIGGIRVRKPSTLFDTPFDKVLSSPNQEETVPF